MATFQLGNLSVADGEMKKGALGSIHMADGSKVDVPLVIINGEKEGPVMVVLAGVHGTEVSGIFALHKTLEEVDAKDLSGTLVGVPGANPIAVATGEYITNYDSTNLSSAFSNSDSEGGMTQRMASYVWDAINAADYVIDMHANPFPSMPFVLTNLSACKDEKTEEDLRKMAEAFGVTMINWNRPVRSMRDVCSSKGVPGITPELAGNLYYWDDIAQVGYKGVINVMKALGMLEGEVEKQDVTPLIEAELGDLEFVGQVRCNKAGFMRVLVEPGQKVEKGKTVVEIYSFLGDKVEEITMPCKGYCWSFTGGANSSTAVCEGTPLAYVFKHVKDA